MAWWKADSRRGRARCVLDDDPKFQCCGCCHVQTGTICLGVYNVLLQMVCMSGLIFAILHPNMLHHTKDHIDFEIKAPLSVGLEDGKQGLIPAQEPGLKPGFENYVPVTGMTVEKDREAVIGISSKEASDFYTRKDMYLFTRRRVESGDAHLALALVFGLLIITVLMIYGAMKSRPVYLLPFFCFQVFDFILACITAVGHYTWLPNLHKAISTHEEMPFRHYLMQMNSEWLALCILLLYVLVLVVKAYFIGIVWASYQYLHLRNSSLLRYSEIDGTDLSDYDAELLLPPDYEAATKLPPVYPPPTDPPPRYTPN